MLPLSRPLYFNNIWHIFSENTTNFIGIEFKTLSFEVYELFWEEPKCKYLVLCANTFLPCLLKHLF